ncbi:MAG TPA: AAA family ATPase [Labilithrix sp.]|nr:AAA family ATPase [Labilithrix sp.]
MPLCIVIAGPNGAGKSTAAPFVLRDALEVKEFVNADTIAAGLAGYEPDRAAIQAGRLMLERLHALEANGDSFAFETTLSTRSFVPLLRRLRATGYTTGLLFFWLPSAEHALARVRVRVAEGGHAIPDDVVRRRFAPGLRNFLTLYSTSVDFWALYDARHHPPTPVASYRSEGPPVAHEPALWESIRGTTHG